MASRFRIGRHVVGVVTLGALVSIAPGCGDDFDTSRATPPRGSLGREMYTLVCDRVGAQALREDITGISYHDVCHADAAGKFPSDKVDTTLLPPLDPDAFDVNGKPVAIEQQKKNRAHRIARIEALARRREDLIDAFDVSFANEEIPIKDLDNPDPTKSCGPAKGDGQADLRPQLADMLGRLTDLYNDDTIPHVTRGLSRVMADVDHDSDAQTALALFDARRGYRPKAMSLGVSRTALSYPHIADLANALLRVLSADTDPLGLTSKGPKKKPADRTANDRVPGVAHAAIVDLFAGMREELRTAKADPTPAPLVTTADTRDPTLVRLSRPRGDLEMARNILLDEDAAFSKGDPTRWVLRRDARGVAKVALAGDKIPAPFVDATGPNGKPDGLADVDELGRFKTTKGDAPTPWPDVLGAPQTVARDSDGRALIGANPAFEYFDVSKTFLASAAKDLVPLVDPDPQKNHETLMDLLGGFSVVAGAREDQPKSRRVYGEGKDAVEVLYRGYKEDASPLLDLVYAVGQVLADKQTDDILALVQKLATDKPQVLARLIGVGLKIKAIADAHPEAKLPANSTLWDELLDVFVAISQKDTLVEDIIRAFANDATLDLPTSAKAYLTMRDELTYDKNNLNGPAFNITTGKVESLKTPVDRSGPDSGLNRSAFQRFLQALHDTKGMSVCTKEGAVAHVVWNGIGIDFPSFSAQAACVVLGNDAPADPQPECGLIRIKNISEELVNAVLGTVNLDIRDDCLKNMVKSPLTGIVGGADAFLEDVSGIKGFNTHPTVPGITRLAYFDLPHDGTTGDTSNAKTLNFLKDTFDVVPTLVCSPYPFTDTDGAQLNLRKCARFEDSIRGRDANALFPIEQLGFIEASKPLAAAFHKSDANLLFVELFDALHRHWGSPAQSKDECDPGAPKTDARWCSQDGAVSYEALIAEALGGDLFPALHDSVKELTQITIQHCESRDADGNCTKQTPWDGVKVLAAAVNDLVDPERNKGLQLRGGGSSVVRNDGTQNSQVTPVYLLIDALKGFDQRLADHLAKNPGDDRLPSWRRARSQVVDQFFSVTGSGTSSKLSNAAIEKTLPVLVATIRSQLSAHCPDPNKTCTWAKTDLSTNMTRIVTGPTFAGALGVADAVRSDEAARTELEKLLVYLLQDDAARPTTLTALADVLQIFEDDANTTALLNAAADAAGPEVLDKNGKVVSRGFLLASIEAMWRILGEVHDEKGERLCSKEVDPNRTLAVVLRKMVTPRDDGKPAPIEILMDVTTDVNRSAPEDTTKLAPPDYGSIAREVSDFCGNPSRGLEQVYTVIKQATKDL